MARIEVNNIGTHILGVVDPDLKPDTAIIILAPDVIAIHSGDPWWTSEPPPIVEPPDVPPVVPPPPAPTTRKFRVNKGGLPIREQPNSGKQIGSCGYGQPVDVFETTPTWWGRIDKGWIDLSFCVEVS